jgi:Tol biopolymer transport system component
VLTAGFASAADPEVSFDGKSILFAAKKEQADPWCIWEMKVDGSEPRKITCGAAGARQPIYQSTVYTITPTNVEPWIQVAFVGVNPGETNEAGVAPNTSLWSVKTDGTALRRLSYNLSNDMDPAILPDGRMIYAGWLRHSAAHGPQGRVALLGVNEDGLDYQMYAGDEGLRVKQMPTPTADGRVVFVESDAIAADGSGRLAAVSQMRPLHSYRTLTKDEDGLFRAPAPLPDGRLLVAWRPGPQPTEQRRSTFGIYRFDPASGAREKVLEEADWESVQAKLVAARAMPDARSSVVREDDPEGKLYAVDVNIHDLGSKLPKGEARRIRIVEGVPAADSKPVARRLLGEIPLAEDGSFQVRIPANTPVQLQLLDADGLAIRSSAWLWVRNHGAQGCVGCHEDQERTPPNRFVKALQSPAPVLNLPPEKRRTVSYAADVKPIVESKCLVCHGAGGRPPRLDGHPGGLDRYLTPGEARRSRALWHLLGRNTARPFDAEAGATAPAPMPTQAGGLSVDEVRAFIEWIDLGGQP